MAGEYTGQVMLDGIGAFLRAEAPHMLPAAIRAPNKAGNGHDIPDLAGVVPGRPPGFCIGCPERPIFAATKLVEQELGKHHIASDIGCHLFSIMPPFELGATHHGLRARAGLGLGVQFAGGEAALDLLHRRRRLLAQRPDLVDRQRRLQQERRRHRRRRQFLFGRDRRAGHPVVARQQPLEVDQASDHRGGEGHGRRNGCARSTAPTMSARCATR